MRTDRRFLVRSALLLGACLVLAIASVQGKPDGQAHAAPEGAVSPLTVIISEIAWGGTAANTADEWIELYNPGTTAVDLTGWRLVSDDGNLAVNLPAGSLQGGGFFLLEHMDDNVVQGVPANLLYGTAVNVISDAGTVLRLQAPDGMGGYTDVDTANLGNPAGWYAGTAGPGHASMERVDVVADGAAAWASNDGVTVNGLDRNGNPLQATAKMLNSTWIQPATDTPTPTASNTPSAPAHFVISEFRSRGPSGANDEFIEIYNASGARINIGGWYLRRSSGCGSSTTKFYTFPSNTILDAGQYYLLAASGASIAGANGFFSPGLADDGGLALFSPDSGTAVDEVGMCTTTLYREGSPLVPLAGNGDQSYARQAGGCYDLDNNLADFALISPPNLQNASSAKMMCAGQATATLTFTPTSTATRTPTRTPTPTKTNTPAPGYPVINEILPHPRSDWNGDGVTNYGDEYIEIVNIGLNEISIKNWKLRNAAGDEVYTLPDMTLAPREMARFFGSETGISLSDGGDGVRLVNSSGKIMDAFDYPVVRAVDRSWCRLPNGNGGWEFGCWPTPGEPNVLSASTSREPTPVPGEICLLADTLPLIIFSAECGSPGDGIWNPGLWEEGSFWLSSRSKWDWFIE